VFQGYAGFSAEKTCKKPRRLAPPPRKAITATEKNMEGRGKQGEARQGEARSLVDHSGHLGEKGKRFENTFAKECERERRKKSSA